jgi:hypothetical protein
VLYDFFFIIFLVNPIASPHFQNAQQQNISQNYSLHPNTMQVNHFDASLNSNNNNFNNFANQFQYETQQQTYPQQNQSTNHQSFETVGQMYQPQIVEQFFGQSVMPNQNHQPSTVQQGLNNGPSSSYQHTINDLLVQQPSTVYQQNVYSSQEHIPAIQSNQSVSYLRSFFF